MRRPAVVWASSKRAPLWGALATLLLAGCGGGDSSAPPPEGYDGPPIPWAFTPFPPVTDPSSNLSSEAKVALGNALFYDPILSGDKTVACATCHSELWGMSDGLPVSIGVGGVGATGPGRTGPNKTTRNALTLWNSAFRTELFWDGRSPSLEDQAGKPLEKPNEMHLPAGAEVARLTAIPAYVALFKKAFPGMDPPINAERTHMALASFERTLVTSRAPYDHYVGGDEGALAASEKRGMKLFASAGCADCHAPPLFESTRYVKRFSSDDPGRFAISKDPKDKGAFRVPTLRNVRESGPYFHDGSVAELDDAVRAEVKRQVEAGVTAAFDDGAVQDIVDFLYSGLEDLSEDPPRPQTVPSGLDVPADGFRTPR